MESIPNEIIIGHILPYLGLDDLLSIIWTNSRLRRLTYLYIDSMMEEDISHQFYDRHLILFKERQKLKIKSNYTIIGYGLVHLGRLVELELDTVVNLCCGFGHLFSLVRLIIHNCAQLHTFIQHRAILWTRTHKLEYLEIRKANITASIAKECNNLQTLVFNSCNLSSLTFNYLNKVKEVALINCECDLFGRLVKRIRLKQKVWFYGCKGVEGLPILPNTFGRAPNIIIGKK
jgi:hypothetical protein